MTSTHYQIEKRGYSIKESVHVSSLCRSSIYNHIKAGRLKAKKVGGRTIVQADSLHELIEGDA